MRKTFGQIRRICGRMREGHRPRRFADPVVAASGMEIERNPMLRLLPEFDLADMIACYERGAFASGDPHNHRFLYLSEPPQRCILPLDAFHVGATLTRVMRNSRFTVRTDTDLAGTVALCAERTEQRVTVWLGAPLRQLYAELGCRGIAHSVEVWDGDRLVGGLIGIAVGQVFSCESLVTRANHASKIALVHLVARLLAGGFTTLDMQHISDHFRRFGAIEISRAEFRARVDAGRTAPGDWHALPPEIDSLRALELVRAAAAEPSAAPPKRYGLTGELGTLPA